MVRLLIICLMLVSSTAPVAADVIATYTTQDGEITIATRDSRHVRMTTSEKNYMLLKEDKIYSISQDDAGNWQVMDMDQMKAFQSSAMAGMFNKNSSKTEYEVIYDDTGMEESIAGYTGTVYQVTVLENGKPVEEGDAVLSKHSDLKKVNEGWSAINAKMGQSLGQDMAKAIENVNKKAKEAGYGGMLRYGNEMTLTRLEKKSLDAAYYQIPKGAKNIQMGGQPPTPPSAVELSQGTDSMDEDVEPQEENTTEDELKEGVQKLFKGLFN